MQTQSYDGTFKLETSERMTEQMCFRCTQVPTNVMRLVRKILSENYMSHPDYKATRKSLPFLQGYSERTGWLLVEFWTADRAECQKFVDYVNRRVAEEIPNDR